VIKVFKAKKKRFHDRGILIMQFEIQRNARISLFKQIYQSFVDRIRSGLLEEGLQFPSVRELSNELGVSLVTVVKKYQQLEQAAAPS